MNNNTDCISSVRFFVLLASFCALIGGLAVTWGPTLIERLGR